MNLSELRDELDRQSSEVVDAGVDARLAGIEARVRLARRRRGGVVSGLAAAAAVAVVLVLTVPWSRPSSDGTADDPASPPSASPLVVNVVGPWATPLPAPEPLRGTGLPPVVGSLTLVAVEVGEPRERSVTLDTRLPDLDSAYRLQVAVWCIGPESATATRTTIEGAALPAGQPFAGDARGCDEVPLGSLTPFSGSPQQGGPGTDPRLVLPDGWGDRLVISSVIPPEVPSAADSRLVVAAYAEAPPAAVLGRHEVPRRWYDGSEYVRGNTYETLAVGSSAGGPRTVRLEVPRTDLDVKAWVAVRVSNPTGPTVRLDGRADLLVDGEVMFVGVDDALLSGRLRYGSGASAGEIYDLPTGGPHVVELRVTGDVPAELLTLQLVVAGDLGRGPQE